LPKILYLRSLIAFMIIRIPLIAFFLLVSFNFAAKAQQDTTVYELGRLNLPKKFTQSVTIKAAELEKIPFTNVTDVITTWLYGYYGDKKSYIYVVDGMLNTDVNAYSIFDIEEITMVQNASIYLNGALPGQVLLLVKTKRNIGSVSGVNFNGQTNLINLRNNASGYSAPSTKNFYHQYYVSAYKNTSNINAGASISFQHNAFPVSKAYAIIDTKPYNSDRFKFNAYFNAKLGTANKLNITAGYVPQNDDIHVGLVSLSSQGTITNRSNSSASQNLLYANIGLVSKISGGLINKLSVGYQTRKTNLNLSQNQTTQYQFNNGGTNTNTFSDTDSSARANSFLINDDLSFNVRIGKISLTPNVNLTYKKITGDGSYYTTVNTQQPVMNYSFARNVSSKASLFLLTPSITLNYDEGVLLQGGFQKPLNNDMYSAHKVKQTEMLPFVNVGVDVLKATGTASKDMALLFSGSYARSLAISGEPFLSLSDQIMYGGSTNIYPYRPGTDFSRKFDQFQAGISFSMLQNRLMFSYNYQLVKTVDYITAVLFFAPSYTFYENVQYDRQTHVNRFALNADVLSKGMFKWRSALNISVFKNNLSSADPYTNSYLTSFTKKNFVTGGMVNRFNYKQLSAGLDLLYCFNQERFGGLSSSLPGNNYYSINLQNIYAGYSFKAYGLKNIEIYANSRNMLMTNASTITDNRRFYGLGFKAEL
jgi:hypothetical protein